MERLNKKAVQHDGTGNEATMQAGSNAAVDGVDEVVMAAGTYTETIDFTGKGITVRSASGNPADVTIDDSAGSSVVLCTSGETSGAVLEGVTISGGAADNGAGMLIDASSPTAILDLENRELNISAYDTSLGPPYGVTNEEIRA